MMTEDYVSFEIAKLLKEKGFPLPSINYKDWVFCMYDENGDIRWGCYHPDYYCRVTLQMAMKWLREIHNIAINIGWGEVLEDKFQWWCIILSIKDGSILRESEYYATYEQACEAAIKYCLENLILNNYDKDIRR